MKLTTARDVAVIGASITTGLAAVYVIVDDLLTSPAWRRPALNPAKTLIGEHFDLYSVGADTGGSAKSTYLRPATEQERESSDAADDLDGVGVFGVDKDGNHVLPGTTEWARALEYSGRLTYYRVG